MKWHSTQTYVKKKKKKNMLRIECVDNIYNKQEINSQYYKSNQIRKNI